MWRSSSLRLSRCLVRQPQRQRQQLAQQWTGRGQQQALPSMNVVFMNSIQSCRTMADYSMSQLKELRAQSGAPIVECKKALQNCNGDADKAMDWLRQHGAAKASAKVSGREAAEGLVGLQVEPNGKAASLVKVKSETDFAGRSASFVDLVTHVADAVLQSNHVGIFESNDEIMSLEANSKSIKTTMEEAIVAIRENLSLGTVMRWTASDDDNCVIIGYVHGRVDGSNAGSAAAMVELSAKDKDFETLQQVGKKLAMHVVAARPHFLNPESVPQELIEKERAILKSQISDSNKPPEVMDKIINGRLRKFYEGICLTEQEHMVEEGNPKVSKALKEQGITLKRFELLTIS